MRWRILCGLAATAIASASSAQAPQPFLPRDAQAVTAMAGAWDLSTTDGARRCRISFNRTVIAGDFMLVGMPVPCRMAMPQLGKRNGWALASDGAIHIGATADEPVLIFTKGRDSSFTSAAGLKLEPVGRSVHGEDRARTVAVAAAQVAPASAPHNAERAKLAGRYSIARSTADVGCTLVLQTTAIRIQGGGEGIWAAALSGDCRDEGLKTFSPAGWRYENSRIFLVAKKSHSIGFTAEPQSATWVKDPPAGRPLLMKRAPN